MDHTSKQKCRYRLAAPLLPSVATTRPVVMRSRSGTARFIEGHHNLERKTIHLRSTQLEQKI
jgi:hypothetical protein